MSRACIPRTGGGFSAGCFALLVSTCVKQRLRVTRGDSTRRTSASRKLFSVILHSVFEVTARYVCGSSHMTCTRFILNGISMSVGSGTIRRFRPSSCNKVCYKKCLDADACKILLQINFVISKYRFNIVYQFHIVAIGNF